MQRAGQPERVGHPAGQADRLGWRHPGRGDQQPPDRIPAQDFHRVADRRARFVPFPGWLIRHARHLIVRLPPLDVEAAAALLPDHGVWAAIPCRALGVSRSWFYKHEDGTLPPRQVRREQLKAEVRRLFAAHRGTYGSPRITAGLREAGWMVSENTVAAVMAELGLAARRKKKRKATTRPAVDGPARFRPG